MKSKFKKLMAAALVLCLMLALLPAGVLAEGESADAGEYDPSITSGGVQPGGDQPGGESGGGDQPGGESGGGEGTAAGYSITYENTKGREFVGGVYANGTIVATSSDESDKFISGATITLTATPNSADFGLFVLKVDGKDIGFNKSDGKYTGTFTMPESNVTVTAEFRRYYDVTAAQTTGGSVSVNPTTYMYGETVTVSVAEDDEYVLESLVIKYTPANGQETTENITSTKSFEMPEADVTVSATFKKVETPPPVVVPDTYNVNVSSTTGGSAWADKYTDLKAGDLVTVTVQPYDGYYLKSLTVGGADVTNLVTWDWYWNWYYGRTGTYSFTVTGDTNVYATFDTWYDGDIACIYDGRFGNVSLNVWSQALDRFVPYTSASKGDLVQVIVEPYNGYAMNSLSISERNYWGSSVDYWQSWKHDNVYYFYMPDSDVNLYVDFTEAVSEHIVYVDTAKNGTLKADTTWAAYGQKVYVTATPDKGYELSSLFVKTARGEQLKVYEAKKADTYYFYMPDEYVTVSAWFAPEASALPFADVSYTNWYYDAVKFVYDKGIMDGVSYYRFAPDATITRGMVVTMLWRMAGEPYESSAGFTDVASGRYYSTAVAWAAKNGIVEGMTSSTFAPDQAITREQLASILYRYARWLGFSGTGTDISGYTDAGKVSDYAYDAMCWAVKTGVVTGTSAKVLDPQGTATRAAAAQMFMNFYNYIY